MDKLSRVLKPVSEAQNADAAVVVLLKLASDASLEILLVKRAENPLDPWSGQMALPGGKRDAKDFSIMQTVVRETLEETSINLGHDCRFLGMLESMRSGRKPNLLVAPFIVLVEYEPVIVLSRELEGYVWASLENIRKSKGFAEFPSRKVSAYAVGENYVWGLTYRILERLFSVLNDSASTRNSVG